MDRGCKAEEREEARGQRVGAAGLREREVHYVVYVGCRYTYKVSEVKVAAEASDSATLDFNLNS